MKPFQRSTKFDWNPSIALINGHLNMAMVLISSFSIFVAAFDIHGKASIMHIEYDLVIFHHYIDILYTLHMVLCKHFSYRYGYEKLYSSFSFHLSLYHLIYFRSPKSYCTYWPIEIPWNEINSFRKENFPFRNKRK